MTLTPAPAAEQPTAPTSPLPAATSTAPVTSLAFASRIILLFAASLAVVFIAYLGWTLPGVWFSSASVKTWGPQQITLTRGAALGGDAALAHFAPDANGLVILSVNDRFAARNYPVLDWQIDHLPDGAAARLLWRNEYAPNAPRQLDIPIENGRLLPITVAQNDEWIGNIIGVALALQMPSPQPFSVGALRALPMDAPATFMQRLREWGQFSGWRGTSVFALEDPGTVPLTFFVIAALALPFLLAGLLLLWRRWRDRYLEARIVVPRSWLYAGLALFCLGWMLLDVRWTFQLAQQARETWRTYGGKDWTQKHLAAEDGELFAFIEKAGPLLPEKNARVFAMAPEAYLRSRVAYHLYPYNVFYNLQSEQPPPVNALRPGDFLLVFQQRGVQYDATQKKIRLPSGAELAADARLIDSGSALFEITGAQP